MHLDVPEVEVLSCKFVNLDCVDQFLEQILKTHPEQKEKQNG